MPAFSQPDGGQVSAGSSSLVAPFDPSLPPVGPRQPAGPGFISVPHPPTIPQDDYNRRKFGIPSRAPNTPGIPPTIMNTGVGGFLPDILPVDPIQAVPTVGFEASGETIFQPPSPSIAAGPVDVMQLINSVIVRFDKAGQQPTASFTLAQWFFQFGATVCSSGSSSCFIVDPSVHYDELIGRFIIVAQAHDRVANTSFILISISNDATYNGGWMNFAVDAGKDGTTPTTNWADFPTLGYDNDNIYITALMFSNAANIFQYAKLRIIKKSDLYNPAIATLPFIDIVKMKNADGTLVSTLQPMVWRGRTGIGHGGIFVNASDLSGAAYLTLWHLSNPTGPNPTLSASTLTGVMPYDFPAPAPQAGTAVLLDTGQSSVLKAVYREGFLYTAQNVKNADSPDTVVYTRISTVIDQVTMQSRFINGNFFYPAMDVPASIGPANAVPRIISGTTTNPADGTLGFAGITNVKAGEDAFDIGVGPVDRWGDYFGGAIDPVTGGLWVTGEYARKKQMGQSLYSTWVSFFPWNTPQTFDDVTPDRQSYHYVNVLKLWGIAQSCSFSPPLFCPANTLNRKELAILVIESIFGGSFSYTRVPYFTDVNDTDVAFPFVQKLRDLNITRGCGASTFFCATTPATRRDAAVFIIRAKLSGLFGDNFAFAPTPFFTDVPATDPQFKFVQKFRELGYTVGCSTTQFCPTAPITREQAATFLVRAFFN